MSSLAIDAMISRAGELRSLPSVYQRLNAIINHPHTSIEDIGKVVSEDPALTARVLRLVNSAFWGIPGKVETISRGITLIGTQQLHDLALATSVVQMFEKLPQDLVSMQVFWRHSLACAMCARTLATLRREGDTERLFAAGLLHDIGSLILYLSNPDKARSILKRCRQEKLLSHDVEREVFGFDHSAIGDRLFDIWCLPPRLREAVAHHHRPDAAKQFPVDAAIVHVADIIATAMDLDSDSEICIPPLHGDAWEKLALPLDAVATVMEEVDRELEEVACAFLNGEQT